MTAHFLAKQPTLATCQLHVLGFSTSDILQQSLKPAFREAGYDVRVSSGGFGVVVPELLKPQFTKPDALIIQMDLQGFFSRDWRTSAEDAEDLLAENIDGFLAALESYAASGNCAILVNSLPAPAAPAAGSLDIFHPDGAAFAAAMFNRRLGKAVRRCNQFTVIDTDLAMAHIAPAMRSDAKLWFYGRIPYSAKANKALATAFSKAYAAQMATPAKVLVLDLDDTLWRGIYGEDGMAGLDCGDDFPGNAFKAFQHECLRLKGQGMLLTVLSKNDEDVLGVFDEHPGMALKREDFVAHRINWEPKPNNILGLAEDLDLGLDSFVFLDDSPHERDAMRRLAPEVRVPELPVDPAIRPDFLRNYSALWPLRLTAEDRSRSAYYAVQSKARMLQRQAGSLGDYLGGLDQCLQVEVITPATLPRIAQMHARTNQFNLTTQRLTEAKLGAMMDDKAGHCVLLGRLKDRFGDHGIVICASVRVAEKGAEIATFLMSCRVIGREVELAFLGTLLQQLMVRGVEQVEGVHIASERNTPVRDFTRKPVLSSQAPTCS